MRDLDYLIGFPGAGKSTLVRALTTRLLDSESTIGRVPAIDYLTPAGDLVATELGKRRDAFSGTDALPMNVLPNAVATLAEFGGMRLFAEGDRLATRKFFDPLRDAGWTITIVLLDVPEDIAAARREARGSNQSEQWLRGRHTKVLRLAADAETAGYPVVRLDGTPAPARIVEQIHTPVLGTLAEIL